MNAFTQMTQRTVRKRVLALVFVLAVALAAVAALAASVPAKAIPITGPAVFVCVKGDEQVNVIAGRSAAQVFRQEGYTCTPERVFQAHPPV
jgi:conjugal transfer/entry exclusion protein